MSTITMNSAAAARDRHVSLPGRLAAASRLVSFWRERALTRGSLLELNEHMLKDIGVSRSDAMREGMKPFWRD